MKIPFRNLTGEYERLHPSIDPAIQRVLQRGRFILDEEVASFEREFAAYCGTKHAVAVASGTEALQIALLAGGVGRGDEVITQRGIRQWRQWLPSRWREHDRYWLISPLLHFPWTRRVWQQPLQPEPGPLCPSTCTAARHDLNPLVEIARRNQLLLLEDCAQAHGARYHGKSVGEWGQMGAFSFYPTKNLGAYGDGGAIVTDDAALRNAFGG